MCVPNWIFPNYRDLSRPLVNKIPPLRLLILMNWLTCSSTLLSLSKVEKRLFKLTGQRTKRSQVGYQVFMTISYWRSFKSPVCTRMNRQRCRQIVRACSKRRQARSTMPWALGKKQQGCEIRFSLFVVPDFRRFSAIRIRKLIWTLCNCHLLESITLNVTYFIGKLIFCINSAPTQYTVLSNELGESSAKSAIVTPSSGAGVLVRHRKLKCKLRVCNSIQQRRAQS